METESNVTPPKKAIRRTWKLLFTMLAILIAGNVYGGQWLLYHDKAIKGQVIEADSGKPIEGALVIALWKLTDVVGEGPGGYAKTVVIETDKDGKFEIPSWINFKPWKLIYTIDRLSPDMAIFKPGYMVHCSHKIDRAGYPNDYGMTPEEKRFYTEKTSITPAKLARIRNDEERLASLDDLSSQAAFSDKPYSRIQLVKIFKAFEAEVNNFANNNKNKADLLEYSRIYQ